MRSFLMILTILMIIAGCAQANITPTTTPTYGLFVDNVSINSQGRVANVAPGATFTVSFDYQLWSNPNGQQNIMWIPVGVETPSGGIDAQDAVGSLMPGDYPGATGSGSVTLTAPTEAGYYAIDFAPAATMTKAQALSAFTTKYDGFWTDEGVIKCSNGVQETADKTRSTLEVWPTLTKSIINIVSPNQTMIYDATGSVITKSGSGYHKITLKSAGIYFVKSGIEIKKVIKD